MDSLTISSLRSAFAVGLEEALKHIAAGRSASFACEAGEAIFAQRAAVAVDAHDGRRTVEFRSGKDFREEARSALAHVVNAVRRGATSTDLWPDYWRRLVSAVQVKELF